MNPLKTCCLMAWLCYAFCGNLVAQQSSAHVLYFPNDPGYVVAFFERYSTTAVHASAIHHVPASIILAAAALESGYGLANSKIIQECNNLYNIKTWDEVDEVCCKDVTEYTPEGDSIFIDSNACFRKYFTAEESIWDYCEMLSTYKRFRHLTQTPRWDYRKWANGLYESGYASDPEYSKKLIRIIEKYGLWRFDPIPCPHPYPDIVTTCEDVPGRK